MRRFSRERAGFGYAALALAMVCFIAACAGTEPRPSAVEPLRVLYVDDAPHWEYRYLRSALLADPELEAQCWLTSADDAMASSTREGVEAIGDLAAAASLDHFDVIILGSAPSEPDSSYRTFVATLDDFVAAGGGLIVLSGPPRSSELAGVLPVRFEDSADRSATTDLRVRLTEAGRSAGCLRLDADAGKSVRLWEDELPRFTRYHRGVSMADDSEAWVIEAETQTPLVAARDVAEGRSLYLGVDELWRWRSVSLDSYHRVWKQLVRYAASS